MDRREPVRDRLRRIGVRLDRPFRGSEVIAAGAVTARRLRSPEFRTLFRGVHVLADTAADPDQAVRAALVRHPEGVVVGTTAAAWWSATDTQVAAWERPVELALPKDARPAPGLLLRRDRLLDAEVSEDDGVRLTTPVRTAFDVARRLGTVDAVVVLEALGRLHGVTVEEVRGLAAEHPHERGLERLWTALRFVEPDARAGVESRVRLALVAAGLPAPEVGHVPLDAATGLPLGVTDLAWPDLRCAILCDRDDETAESMGRLLVATGWVVKRIDREGWRYAPERVVENAAIMLRFARRAQRRPEDAIARIVATWPSRAPRRRTTVRLYR